MYLRAFRWHILIGLGTALIGIAAVSYRQKVKEDLSQLHYRDVVGILQQKQDRFVVQHLTASDCPSMGYLVTRVGDPRTREELASANVFKRVGFAVIANLKGFSLEEPMVQIRFRDGEISGDVEIVSELVGALTE